MARAVATSMLRMPWEKPKWSNVRTHGPRPEPATRAPPEANEAEYAVRGENVPKDFPYDFTHYAQLQPRREVGAGCFGEGSNQLKDHKRGDDLGRRQARENLGLPQSRLRCRGKLALLEAPPQGPCKPRIPGRGSRGASHEGERAHEQGQPAPRRFQHLTTSRTVTGISVPKHVELLFSRPLLDPYTHSCPHYEATR